MCVKQARGSISNQVPTRALLRLPSPCTSDGGLAFNPMGRSSSRFLRRPTEADANSNRVSCCAGFAQQKWGRVSWRCRLLVVADAGSL